MTYVLSQNKNLLFPADGRIVFISGRNGHICTEDLGGHYVDIGEYATPERTEEVFRELTEAITGCVALFEMPEK